MSKVIWAGASPLLNQAMPELFFGEVFPKSSRPLLNALLFYQQCDGNNRIAAFDASRQLICWN